MGLFFSSRFVFLTPSPLLVLDQWDKKTKNIFECTAARREQDNGGRNRFPRITHPHPQRRWDRRRRAGSALRANRAFGSQNADDRSTPEKGTGFDGLVP